MTFQTVEQLQAQIASLTEENEAFRHEAEIYREMKAEYEILLARSQRETGEIERLRELLREVSTYFHGAIKHNILNALQPKEGEG